MRTGVNTGLIIAVALAIAGCFGVGAHAWVIGSAEGGWTYNYVRPWTIAPVLIALAIAAGASLLLRLQVEGRHIWLLLVTWVAFATLAQAALLSRAPAGLAELYASPHANSFYSLTQQQTASELLGRFNRVRLNSPLHARSNMPGKTIVTYALELLSTDTTVLPWLVVILSNLGALLMFVFVRDIFEDNRTALYAAVLYLFVPSRVFFFPLMNTITPVVVLGCACLLMKWLRSGSTMIAMLFGVALYGLVFFEPLPLVMGLMFAALCRLALRRNWLSLERWAVQCSVILLTFIATAEAIGLATGFQLLSAFRQIQAHAFEFNATEGRPYTAWIVGNIGEFLFGTGIAQAVLVLVAALRDERESWTNWWSRPTTLTAVGLLAVFVVTDLAGVNRGEVTRLWIFLACFFQIPAAYVCGRLPGTGAMAAIVSVTLLHIAMAIAMVRFVVPS